MFTRSATRLVMCIAVVAGSALGVSPAAHAWSWPVDGAVLRGFSVGDDKYAAGQHRGIDVAVGTAPVVRAPASGEVTFAGQVPTHGLTVTITTSGGVKASLTHLGPLRVRRGALVAEGDAIADPGPSGEAEHAVPYVHLGIRVGEDRYVDPLGFLPSRSVPFPPPAPAAPPAPPPAVAPAPQLAPAPEAAQPEPVPETPPAPQLPPPLTAQQSAPLEPAISAASRSRSLRQHLRRCP